MVIMISKIDAIDKKVYNMNVCPSLFIEMSVSSQETYILAPVGSNERL
jgi:hypothetical protein